MFEAINAALDKDLSRIKRAMADTIAAANDAHAAKERAQAETANLKLQVGEGKGVAAWMEVERWQTGGKSCGVGRMQLDAGGVLCWKAPGTPVAMSRHVWAGRSRGAATMQWPFTVCIRPACAAALVPLPFQTVGAVACVHRLRRSMRRSRRSGGS